MLKMHRITTTYDMKVFTDEGDYFGEVEDCLINDNKISSWRIKATRNSYLSRILGNAKGVIVPHQLVKAIGDIVIISSAAVPSHNPREEDEF